MDVKMVGIRDLQKHLSFHLDALRQGDTLVSRREANP
jgi:antitoxin (DNA-binding transcriptional repressor) of toxin-antitoxin stability system